MKKTLILIILLYIWCMLTSCIVKESTEPELSYTEDNFKIGLEISNIIADNFRTGLNETQLRIIQDHTSDEAFQQINTAFTRQGTESTFTFIPLDELIQSYINAENNELDVDERITEVEGIRGIYRKDLYFIGEKAYVKIGDSYIVILESEYPESAGDIRDNPSYIFELTGYNYYDNGLFIAKYRTIQPEPIYEDNYEEIIEAGGHPIRINDFVKECELEIDMVLKSGKVMHYRQWLAE